MKPKKNETTLDALKDSLDFEAHYDELLRLARKAALRGRIRPDEAEEVAAAALVLLWHSHNTDDFVQQPLTEYGAVWEAIDGGGVIDPVLSKCRLGYRAVEPRNAISYAEHYGLGNDTEIRDDDLATVLANVTGCTDTDACRWVQARLSGASHAEAGAEIGRSRSGSERLARSLQRKAMKRGHGAVRCEEARNAARPIVYKNQWT